MNDPKLKEVFELAEKLVAAMPPWKRNLLEDSLRPTARESREPIPPKQKQ